MPNCIIRPAHGNEVAQRAAANLFSSSEAVLMVVTAVNEAFMEAGLPDRIGAGDVYAEVVPFGEHAKPTPDLKLDLRIPPVMYAQREFIRDRIEGMLKTWLAMNCRDDQVTTIGVEPIREESCGRESNRITGEVFAEWGGIHDAKQ